MDLLRKYGGILAVILVIGILFLICVLVGIRASGRDLPSWKRATDGVQTQMHSVTRFIKETLINSATHLQYIFCCPHHAEKLDLRPVNLEFFAFADSKICAASASPHLISVSLNRNKK